MKEIGYLNAKLKIALKLLIRPPTMLDQHLLDSFTEVVDSLAGEGGGLGQVGVDLGGGKVWNWSRNYQEEGFQNNPHMRS